MSDIVSPSESEPIALAPTSPASTSERKGPSRFWIGLLVVVGLGALLRVGYLSSQWHRYDCDDLRIESVGKCVGDEFVYHHGANLVADGEGFITPTDYYFDNGFRYQGADHPPAYTVYLSAFSVMGLDTYRWHQIATMLLGVASIVVAGLLGREIAGVRLGHLAAAAVALYPMIWVNDALVLSETMTILAVVTSALFAYRFWHHPTWSRAVALGAVAGLSTLTRAEVLAVFPFVVVPLALAKRHGSWRRRLSLVAVIGVVGALVIAPWVVRNLRTFDEPVLLSNGLGITMAYANCDQTYHGAFLGFWYFPCKTGVALDSHVQDQSVQDKLLRKKAVDYIKDHKGRVPVVLAARLGRVWGVFRPTQVMHFDQLESRPLWVTTLGFALYYPLIVLAVVGLVALRKRRVPIAPLLAPFLIVSIAVLLAFAQNRYRATCEATLAVAAMIGADALAGLLSGRGWSGWWAVPTPGVPSAQTLPELVAAAGQPEQPAGASSE